jgi:hypothetical protein
MTINQNQIQNQNENPILNKNKNKNSNIDSKKYKIIEYVNYNTEKLLNQNEETFCEAFTIIGAGLKEPTFLYNNETSESFCGHENCSAFDPYKPEILFRYPTKDTKKLELNSLVN